MELFHRNLEIIYGIFSYLIKNGLIMKLTKFLTVITVGWSHLSLPQTNRMSTELRVYFEVYNKHETWRVAVYPKVPENERVHPALTSSLKT